MSKRDARYTYRNKSLVCCLLELSQIRYKSLDILRNCEKMYCVVVC